MITRMRSLAGGLFATIAALAGCGGGHGSPDAPGACWPLPSTPGGQVELGTGDLTFMTMPATLPIVTGQSLPGLRLQARLTGIPGGDPTNFLDKANPRTMFSGAIDSLGWTMTVPCPATFGYKPDPDQPGAYILPSYHALTFSPDQPYQQAYGQQIRITIEVVGSNGLYAKDEKTVTIEAPAGAPPDAGVDAAVDAM